MEKNLLRKKADKATEGSDIEESPSPKRMSKMIVFCHGIVLQSRVPFRRKFFHKILMYIILSNLNDLMLKV